MKEVSVEEKAKRYYDVLEKAKKLHDENCDGCKVHLESLFPELKEICLISPRVNEFEEVLLIDNKYVW